LAGWLGTVYHGLPENLFQFHEAPGDYLAFLGRISPEKRVDRAIEIARLAGMPLKIAAKVDRVDQDYFNAVIKPLLDPSLVEFIGEIGGKEKEEFLGKAHALLFPIDWPEPFGLVMIEAMACGAPVIAWPHGSVPEVLEDGAAGFVVEEVEEAARAVERLASFDRRMCREVFERRFTASRMAGDYVNIYEHLLEKDPMIGFRMAENFRNQGVFAGA
jgi:glycosyltransferase involved in cell wall biosynthesis